MIKTVEWTDGGVVMVDQRYLPTEELYPVFRTYQEVAFAIKEMVIRGAPAIGVAAAMGIARGALDSKATSMEEFERDFNQAAKVIAATRPTAVNLFWAVDRMTRLFNNLKAEGASIDEIRKRLIVESK